MSVQPTPSFDPMPVKNTTTINVLTLNMLGFRDWRKFGRGNHSIREKARREIERARRDGGKREREERDRE